MNGATNPEADTKRIESAKRWHEDSISWYENEIKNNKDLSPSEIVYYERCIAFYRGIAASGQ